MGCLKGEKIVLEWDLDTIVDRIDDTTWYGMTRPEMEKRVDDIVQMSKMIESSLIAARNQISRPGIAVMKFLSPGVIGEKIEKVEKEIERGLTWIKDMNYLSKENRLFHINEKFFKDNIQGVYRDLAYTLGENPTRSLYFPFLNRTEKKFERADHLSLFKGDGTSGLGKYYDADAMPTHHHDAIVHELPKTSSTNNLHVLRNLLIDDLLSEGMNAWLESK